MENDTMVIITLGLANIPIYIFLGKVFFGGWEGFFEALFFWFKPDLFSAFHGEFWDDWWAEFKLAIFIVACVALVWGEFGLFRDLFPASG